MKTHASSIPNTMRACQGKDYGPINEMISVQDGVKVPRLSDLPPKDQKKFMIVKTEAVSLACGDCRVLSGLTRELQGPPSFPYIPCGDCCGYIVELPEQEEKGENKLPFQIGDRVAARFVIGPRDALAEYAIVSTKVADKVPPSISSVDAAALASACPATVLADRINEGDRVLILGAGGGVGSHVCQLAKKSRGASLVVGVSRSPERLLQDPIACDRAIDYTKQDVFEMEEFINNPFDTILDFSSGGWPRLMRDYNSQTYNKSIVKPFSQGGRYITTTPDEPIFEAHSVWTILSIVLFPPLFRAIQSRTWARSRLPGYTYAFALPAERSVVTRMLDYANKGILKAVVDPKGPFPFTTDGVRAAFNLQETRHAHGKSVVDTTITKDEQ